MQEFMLHKFKITSINPKYFLCKRWRCSDCSRETRWFKKFCPHFKKINNQTRSDRAKTRFQTIETNPASKFGIWLFTVVCHLHFFGMTIRELLNCASYINIAKLDYFKIIHRIAFNLFFFLVWLVQFLKKKTKHKSKFSWLALLFKPFFVKIQPNMSEQEKKW